MAYRYQISQNKNLSLATMRTLQCVLWDHNAYTPIYQHVYEVLREYDAPDYTVRLCVVPGNNLHQYNLPTVNEVAIILPGEDIFQGNHRDIIIHLQPEHHYNLHDHHDHIQLHHISKGHAAYAPLHYVSPFPYGEAGWYYDLWVPNSSRRLTLLQYTAYRIHSRLHEFSTILHGC